MGRQHHRRGHPQQRITADRRDALECPAEQNERTEQRRQAADSGASLPLFWCGTCYGDSGGPHFVGAGASETNMVVSVTVTGDAWCRATDKTYRLDTASARDFLGDFVVLP
jgi:hypothetical protein